MIKLIKSQLWSILLGLLIVFFTGNNALAANLSNITVSSVSNALGATTNETITFTTSATGAIPQGGMIWINYPTGFNLSGASLGADITGNLGNAALNRNVNTIVIVPGAGSNIGNSTVVSFRLDGVVNPSISGNYTVTVETQNSLGQNIDGPNTSSTFTIGQVLDHFSVTPSATSATAGSNLTLTITAKDASNATIASYNGSPTLSGLVTSPNGTAPYYGTASFTNGIVAVVVRGYSTQANQSITVTDNGRTGNTGIINFTVGALGSINISPNSNQTITAGQTLQFTASSTDSYGNLRTGDTFTWNNTTNSGLFNTTSSGTYAVYASSGSINSNLVNVTVAPASLDHITISPNSNQTIKAGSSLQFTATACDQYGNVRNDVISWTGTNTTGLFTANIIGSYNVKASVGNVSSTNITVTVTHADAVDHLTISPTDIHLSNADQSQTYIVWALDQYGNSWDVSSQVSFSSTDPKGSFSSNTYHAGQVGSWKISATLNDKSVSTNVTIDNAGTPNKVELTNGVGQINLNAIYQFKVNAYDADGNQISNPNISWSVLEGSDNSTIDSTGRFMANKVSSYKVKAQSGNASVTFAFNVVDPNANNPVTQPPKNDSGTKSNDSSSGKTKTQSSSNSISTNTKNTTGETTVEVTDDSQGKIKATEITTEGLDQDSTQSTNKWVLIASIIIGLAILALAYWGYTIWANPLAEESANSKLKSETPKKIVKNTSNDKMDEIKEIGDNETRW